ncbi:zinc-dependent peptidase [Sulfuricystis thermophila]|uniref:M90 family metallopeptidase n=1 Tax=Sulfuricystis thermophila TaxID=2496847 RepID=UPI0010367316|nr:M90 family metallopeptidase [Sulfuricystis thermophila]
MFEAWRNWRRERAASRIEITADQWREAEYPLPFLDRLGEEDRQRLRALAREFIASKEWSGAQGLQLTAQIQLSIALQACLPILNLGLDWYRGWIGIVVYPGDFVIPRQIVDEDGVVHEYDDPVLGEAWEGGPVLLSWFDDPTEPGDVSIVIHEFAHKLDMTNGAVDGMPRLHAEMRAADWSAAYQSAFDDFCRRVEAGEKTAIDPYAAEHPSEFFAVTSEVFFEAPDLLMAAYPAVYAQLALFYRQDPLRDTGNVVALQQA